MLSYINMVLIVVVVVLVFVCFMMYFQAKSLFDKISLRYASALSTDMKVNDPFEKIWTGKS